MKKYIIIFSIAIFLVAGSVLAEQTTTWTKGNFRYTRVNGGIKVEQINRPVQTPPQQRAPQRQVPAPQNPTPAPVLEPATEPVQETPQQQSINVASLASVSDINVTPGTDLSLISLPATAVATMSDDSTLNMPVAWDSGTPVYDASIVGTYVFSGVLTLPENTTNTDEVKASVNVVVQEQQPEPEINPVINILEEASAGLLNSTGEFIKFIFSPFKALGNIFKK
jgi:hypothetical protein